MPMTPGYDMTCVVDTGWYGWGPAVRMRKMARESEDAELFIT